MASLKQTGAVLTIAAAAISGCAIQFEASSEYEEGFAPAGAAQVVLEGLDGDVVVRGMDLDTVQIRGTRHAVGATRREARRRLGRASLDARYDGAALVLEFSPSLEDTGLVDLELDRASTLPSAMGISAEVESGDIEVSGLAGAIDLETGGGDIDLEDPGTGNVLASSEDGSIDYALALTGFRIECDPGDDGAVLLDDALQSLVDAGTVQRTEEGGIVVLGYGSAAKAVALTAEGGDISVSLLSRSPKTWQ
jgi:hypothetical protein